MIWFLVNKVFITQNIKSVGSDENLKRCVRTHIRNQKSKSGNLDFNPGHEPREIILLNVKINVCIKRLSIIASINVNLVLLSESRVTL